MSLLLSDNIPASRGCIVWIPPLGMPSGRNAWINILNNHILLENRLCPLEYWKEMYFYINKIKEEGEKKYVY